MKQLRKFVFALIFEFLFAPSAGFFVICAQKPERRQAATATDLNSGYVVTFLFCVCVKYRKLNKNNNLFTESKAPRTLQMHGHECVFLLLFFLRMIYLL